MRDRFNDYNTAIVTTHTIIIAVATL